MENSKRETTEREALLKLSALCASAEYCIADIQKKLDRYQLAPDEQTDREAKNRVVQRLVAEGYIDETRYAHAFVRDKFRYNHWGKVRIERELHLRHIKQDIIDEAIVEEITLADNHLALQQLIDKKRRSVTGKTAYEIRGKLIRFAVGRGFAIDDIMAVIDELLPT